MKSLLVSLLLLTAAVTPASAKNADTGDPVAWGILSHNTGCVIFAEGHKTKGMFWGVAVTEKIMGKLTLIETQNYTFNQKEVIETQDAMNDLMRRAEADHVKYVKIPEKYSPDQLQKARAMCTQDQ